jgi:molybdopterin molybdotransferase
MPEFLTLLPPDEARALLLATLPAPTPASQASGTDSALGRVTAEDVVAPHPLPAFPRSTVDGYAVRARDTYGASDTLPGYLTLVGEVPMGAAPALTIGSAQCALIHTGGMLPPGADAVVMLEYTQPARAGEIEIQRAVAEGENVIRIGEDVAEAQVVISRGTRLRPAEIGGLMALGISGLRVAKRVKIGLISSGDEVVPPGQTPQPGQVRDVNSYTLAALVTQSGGEPVLYGIVSDSFDTLKTTAMKALNECDLVVITAGSSASTRDMTAEVIAALGAPGVLVHGINTRPGKPTILGVCNGKAVIGLPGNPVSALVNGYLFVVPVIEKLLGIPAGKPKPSVKAKLTVNLASQAGREDWQPVRLTPLSPQGRGAGGEGEKVDRGWLAEPIFGKSNLIFSLAAADGLVKIPSDATGLSAGEIVEVFLMP